MTHRDKIRREFSRQAAFFGGTGLTLSSQEYLDWMVGVLPLNEAFRALDVAAGTAHLSQAIAPHVREVVAIDMTPAMLEEARKTILRKGIENIRLEEGDVRHLPYADKTFDMVVSRLAVHHFENPEVELREMVRVCKPGHIVGIIDLLSPDDETLIERYNHLERLRDPSHTKALIQAQLVTIMRGAGLSITLIDTRNIPVDFQRWVAMTEADEKRATAIRNALEQEIDEGYKTGMRPYREDGRLKFLQVWSVIIGKKSAEGRTK